MKNIMITGGAGFIGSALYKSLKKKYKNIYIIDNFSDYYDIKLKLYNLGLKERISKNSNYNNIYNIDIKDDISLNRFFKNVNIDLIIHLAAFPGVHLSNEKKEIYFANNVSGSFNIFNVAKKYDVKKIIFASSSSVYGNENKIPFKEDLLPSPVSFYGCTKIMGENMASFFSKNFDLDIIILRFFTFYGPAQRPDLMLHKFFLNHYNDKISTVYRKTSRDFTYIDDGIEMIKRVVDSIWDFKGFDIFNIGSSDPVKIEDVVKIIKKIIPDFKYYEEERKEFDMQKTFADMKKFLKIYNYSSKVDIEEGIKRFYSWFKKYYRV